MLYQVITDVGHLFDLYPKFHCEYNWTERYWGVARLDCSYTFRALEENMPGFLDKANDIAKIRKYYEKCWKYIEVYHSGLNGTKAAEEIKKLSKKRYLSHRRITMK